VLICVYNLFFLRERRTEDKGQRSGGYEMERKEEERGKSSKRCYKLSKEIAGTAGLFVAIAIVVLFLTVTPVMAQEADVTVTVNAPEYVEEGKTFDVTIDVEGITDFNIGVFDLAFDHKIVEVKKVTDGSIDDTKIPIAMWDEMNSDTIKVISELSGKRW
jgi:hypothetical protein